MRTGEAKLRGRMIIVVLIAWPLGCEYPGVGVHGFSLSFCCCCSFVFNMFSMFCYGSTLFFVVICIGLEALSVSSVHKDMVLSGPM